MQDNEELESNEFAPNASNLGCAVKKRRIVKLLLVYSAILGVVYAFIPDADVQLDFVLGLPIIILGVSWSFTDATERGHRIGRLTKLFLVLFFIVGFPIYLFQTRGAGAFKSLAWFAVLIVAMNACAIVAGNATVYAGVIAGIWKFAD